MKNTCLFALFIGLFIAASTAVAAPQGSSKITCDDVIKSCFALSGNEQSNCFHSASKDAHCSKTPMGELAKKRWSVSSIQLPGSEGNAVGFLGPEGIDAECVKNFDAKWSGALMTGPLTKAAISGLEKSLTSCKREVLLQP